MQTIIGRSSEIVGDHIIKGNGPTAISSRIGYLLSGPLLRTAGTSLKATCDVISAHVAITDRSRFSEIESKRKSSTKRDSVASGNHQVNRVTLPDKRYARKSPVKQDHLPQPSKKSYDLKRGTNEGKGSKRKSRRRESNTRRLQREIKINTCHSRHTNDGQRRNTNSCDHWNLYQANKMTYSTTVTSGSGVIPEV